MPLVSVITPVYNIEKYLPECLDSLISHSVQDAEFICVNDGSSDGSLKILNEYASKDNRFRIIDKENGGVSSARNAGLDAAAGDWVMFLDGDDRFRPEALDRVCRLADTAGEGTGEKTAPEIIVFQADIFPGDIENEPWWKKTLKFPEKRYEKFEAGVLFEERGAMPFMWRHAYRRELLERSGARFNESIVLGEDSLFPMSVFPAANGIWFVPDCLYDYRLGREGSAMDTEQENIDNVVSRHFDVIKAAAGVWNEKGWMELYGGDFLGWALKYTILKVKALDSGNRKKRAGEMFGIIKDFGLEKYKGRLDSQGKLLWLGYKVMK